MKKFVFAALTASLFLAGRGIGSAQDMAQSDEIRDGETEEIIQDDSSATGTFEAVTVDPGATSDVKLQFPVNMAGKVVVTAPLDGGVVQLANAPTIDPTGLFSFSFQVTDQPGVHRVIVIDPNADEDSLHIVGVVQFEVPSPVE